MYAQVQPFIQDTQMLNDFAHRYKQTKEILFQLLDSPVQFTQHIGGTRHMKYPTEPILDILVGVENLHQITALDEKRLNYVGFYRLHHAYHKKVMMAQFNNLTELKQISRIHIIQMSHPIFKQYQTIDHLLETDISFATQFASYKEQIISQQTSIRSYEAQKEAFFIHMTQHRNYKL